DHPGVLPDPRHAPGRGRDRPRPRRGVPRPVVARSARAPAPAVPALEVPPGRGLRPHLRRTDRQGHPRAPARPLRRPRPSRPRPRFIHLATHGRFRRDNPMFSSVQLGTSRLSLFDLYQLDLPAELVTLSGCGTGLNVTEGGDEVLGLVRGLLYAGTQSALVTLWDVHDLSTSEFMTAFYSALASEDKGVAVRRAILE